MIKYLLLISLVVIAVYAEDQKNVRGRRECKTSSDCEEEECCLQRGKFPAVCKKRIPSNARCQLPLVVNEETLVYKGKCPCVTGHECQRKTVGKRVLLGRCKKVGEGTTAEPVATEEPGQPEEPEPQI